MPLDANALGGLIQTNLKAFNANGPNLTVFCNAVGKGICDHIIGKPFVTADVGSAPGAGVGAGIGIIGLSPADMAQVALSTMSSKGPNADKFMQAIMLGIVTHLAEATLTSVHSPVYAGAGTIVPGSIGVDPDGLAGTLQNALKSANAKGPNLGNLCKALATGITTNILANGTGIVIISGAGGPGSGSGSGSGVIS